MNELISVIIPVRNGENFLSEAIEGIRSQGMDVEILVVDDASDDRTAEIAEAAGCRVIRHESCLGQVAGKNSGLRVAHGEFILFHDHDDVMRSGSLRRLYDGLRNASENTGNADGAGVEAGSSLTEAPRIAAVMAKVQDFYTPGLGEDERRRSPIKPEPYYGLFTGAVLLRKSVFDEVGPFPENINTGEIIDLEFRMKSKGLAVKKLDFVSTDRRVHASNYGKTNRQKEFADYLSVLRSRMVQNMKK